MGRRAAKKPLILPENVQVQMNGQEIIVKNKQDELRLVIHPAIKVDEKERALHIASNVDSREGDVLLGTTFRNLSNMIQGVTEGFTRKLLMVGVGYRATLSGKLLTLAVGKSHPVELAIPDGLAVEVPSVTEIIIKGNDKQKVGQFAAIVRSMRPLEPYKGKGIRYDDELVIRKEAKKK